MDLSQSLIVYFVVVIVLILVFCRIGIHVWSAIVIALIIGQILLNILISPKDVNVEVESGSMYAIYVLIQLATLIVVYIYALIMGFRDKQHPQLPLCC